MIQGFKEFISRGNAIDLAVAVIIGGAFSPIVKAITDVIMAIIGGVIGKPSFDEVGAFVINDSQVQPGTILTAIVNFLLVAFAVYFAVVVPMNKFKEMRKKEEDAEEDAAEPTDEAKLLTEIRDLLARQN
ncbi:large conductance mechanosensitive channel protein MscL [Schaalia sp. 19OD2882]|uniref:large conductance mechanosensitive channel protein MscL n=1 Tax=Schaalia sp. 19OD2882 TaxID=2794089 RepID=UPI001C1F09A2|nr:large conductance mechanosensitive channel protein MscL [Schaalia sp. 19OD2882]QWW19937.1 large conductance mechanosensitive channel protein MscL [Schaalia sp. 19OD2882]